jgi:hypothetical protein
MTTRTFNLGDSVKVSYTGYYITGTYEGVEDGRPTWLMIRQDCGYTSDGVVQGHNDYRLVPAEDRPLIPAAAEFVVHADDPLAPSPMENLLKTLSESY